MKNFIETLKNIWKIEELRSRIMVTLGFILIFRIGSYVVIPGVDLEALEAGNSGNSGGLFGLLALFTGGAFSRASIFALGIMPYISASIIMQLLGIAVPSIQKMQREGESGQKRINQITRFLTIGITSLQAPGYLASSVVSVPNAVPDPSWWWWFTSVIILSAGCLFVMWMGERITDRGIGNGISLLIMIGIIASLPASFIQEVVSKVGVGGEGGGFVILLVEIVFLLLIIAATIALVQATRRVPVQFAKRVVGNRQYGGVRQYIPLKVNAAGVMPIIFAQAIMFVPLYIAQALEMEVGTVLQSLTNINGLWYNIIFFLMVVLFTYFYTAITVNPMQMADDLKRNGGFIPGVKPGRKTSEFLDNLLSRITLPGAIFLGFVAILPAFAVVFGVTQGFALFFGGTSLLIMVGVVLDTLQQIESHLLSRHYDGLMKGGKIKGRSSSAFGMAG
ncbi:MAG: preprotein translocase subunit SecY [Flavobacteriales bacterium]|nr:preprotein translocase subunit SecY [Flavobacteriales bacterium]